MSTVAVEMTDFQKDVYERSFSVPVVADFWAAWCAPCRMLTPVLEKLAGKYKGRWDLVKIDTEAFPEVAQEFGIRSIPSVKMFVDGVVAAEFTGALPELMIESWLKKSLPSKTAKELDTAEALLKGERRDEGIALLEKIISLDPDNLKSRVLLAREIFADEQDRALALIAPIDESSEYFEGADALRTLAEIAAKADKQNHLPEGTAAGTYRSALSALKSRNYGTALEKFIDVIREDRYFDDDGSRKACIAIFKFLGEDHPTVVQYRKIFNSALYV